MEPECSLPHSQVPTTCLYPEPAQSSPYPHILLLKNSPSSPKSLVPLSLFRLYQIISPGPRLCLWIFRNKDTFSKWEVVSTLPNPQAEGPSLVSCLILLIQYIPNYPPYWRPFLHPQPEDAPCRGDRDPLITWVYQIDVVVNPLPPNDTYICHTSPLTSRRCILNIYSTNIRTKYLKHAA
jgi:hypothetical protein